MRRAGSHMTVGELREVLADLPDHAAVTVDEQWPLDRADGSPLGLDLYTDDAHGPDAVATLWGTADDARAVLQALAGALSPDAKPTVARVRRAVEDAADVLAALESVLGKVDNARIGPREG